MTDLDVTANLQPINPNVKDFDQCRRNFAALDQNIRQFVERIIVEAPPPPTWTGASYTPTIATALWEGHTSPPAARQPVLGTGSAVSGHSWSLAGWTFVTAQIKWGANSSPRDTGYGKYQFSLPSTPYNTGRSWLGHGFWKQQYTVSSGSPVSDDQWSFQAKIRPGTSVVELYANTNVSSGYGPWLLGLGGGDSSGANTNRLNFSDSLGTNALFEFNIWYRTEA